MIISWSHEHQRRMMRGGAGISLDPAYWRWRWIQARQGNAPQRTATRLDDDDDGGDDDDDDDDDDVALARSQDDHGVQCGFAASAFHVQAPCPAPCSEGDRQRRRMDEKQGREMVVIVRTAPRWNPRLFDPTSRPDRGRPVTAWPREGGRALTFGSRG